ncbi:MAG: hypothetical protein K6347_00265 [Campylobacterales bacterium]
MELVSTKKVLEPIIDILEHIKGVQEDMITLSARANDAFYDLIESAGLAFDERATIAMQYQDIFSQQLGAIIHAINSITAQMKEYLDADTPELLDSKLEELRRCLNDSLEEARHKKKAFMGKALNSDETCNAPEFF